MTGIPDGSLPVVRRKRAYAVQPPAAYRKSAQPAFGLLAPSPRKATGYPVA